LAHIHKFSEAVSKLRLFDYRITPWANKKRGALLLSISLPTIDKFPKFLQQHTLWTVCINVIVKYPTTP